jgi:hypothetical protein
MLDCEMDMEIMPRIDELWYRLLQAKYMHRNNFFLSKNKGVSQFWQGLHQVKHLFQWGATNKIKNGERDPVLERRLDGKGAY